MPSSEKIVQLRALLAERFPESASRPGACLATGIPRFDDLLEGGLWKGALTELASPAASAGSALVFTTLLHTLASENRFLALIDGRDTFDPQPIDNSVLAHLLWVRCQNADQAIRAADLLLRDGNLPLVALDLRCNPDRELRRIPTATWYRLQRILERNDTAGLVITPRPMIPSAQVKLTLENRFEIDALSETQNALLERLQVRIARRRFAHSKTSYDPDAQRTENLRVAEAG